MGYDEFFDKVEFIVDKFKQIPKDKTIRIVSHLDADGICSASILIKALDRDDRNYVISIIPQLTAAKISEFAKEKYSVFFFLDLGSSNTTDIERYFKDKSVFILDHHKLEKPVDSLIHLNPHLFNISGYNEISGAGVVFFFAKTLNEVNVDMAKIALVGATGDVQGKEFGFLNKQILEIGKKAGNVKVEKGLRFFGVKTRPLHKLLQYSTDPIVPGAYGSESKAVQFIKDVGINPRDGNKWKMISDLTKDELKALTDAIIVSRFSKDNSVDIFGDIISFVDENADSSFSDAKEFATILNSCGRLDKSSIGIGACLNDEKMKSAAITVVSNYRTELIKAISWYNDNRNTPSVIEDDDYKIINAKDYISPRIIGTVSSIISMGGEVKEGIFIVSLARDNDNKTKISLRVAGSRPDVDLREILTKVSSMNLKLEFGGHSNAAGAIINTEDEQKFIDSVRFVLDKICHETVIR